MAKFKVGNLVKYKRDVPRDWGKNCYKIDFVDEDVKFLQYRMRSVDKDIAIWVMEDQIEEYPDELIIEETAEKMIKEHTEVEQLLVNNDRELKYKAEMYDKICDKLFMATGIIEDGNSIQYIIDPELIINEIIKIITEIPFSRESQREKKRSFIRSIRGTDW